jgi:hypothetical protein
MSGWLQVRKKKAEKEALVATCREDRRTLEDTIACMRDGISQAAGLFARRQAELEAHEGARPHCMHLPSACMCHMNRFFTPCVEGCGGSLWQQHTALHDVSRMLCATCS